MNTKDLISMAVRNLLKRKLRTVLTVLGVVIGTASIVVMISIGIGMNESFAKQLEGWGSLQVVDVSPSGGMDYDEESGRMKQTKKQDPLDDKAVETFKQIEHVEAVSPIKQNYFMLGAGKYVADANIIGIDPAAMEALGYEVEQGRTLSAEDTKAVVVGGAVEFYDPKLSWEMRMSGEPPEVEILDKKIEVSYDWNYGTRYADKSIKPVKMEVVGTLPEESSDSWSVFMPIKELDKLQKLQETWQNKQYGGRSSSSSQNQKKEYDQVRVKVDDMDNVQEVQQQIKDMGFRANSLTDQLEAMKETTKMLRIVLGAIGAISMVVAAISITNTMVMAIYERTREIGIMKVIGASLRDIKLLFLTEAAFIGLAGGLVGAVVSFGVSQIVNLVAAQQGSEMTSSIPIWLYLGAIAFATGIGILSGYLPAQRAMRLSALTAIKTE